jgi:hypothetical protein
MKFSLLFSITLSLMCSLFTHAQPSVSSESRAVQTYTITPSLYTSADNYDSTYFEIEINNQTTFEEDGPFTAFSLKWDNVQTAGQVHAIEYFSQGSWEKLPLNHHIEQPADALTSELGFFYPNDESHRVKIITEGKPSLNLELHLYNPGHTEKVKSTKAPNQRSMICPCPAPDYQVRNEWCPAGNCPTSPSPTTTDVKFLIVHHSAGQNTASDWAAVVRSIWDFHVNTNGWSDIGYNWLIDPEGTLYEGRGYGIFAAHFCFANSQTMGVCMIGNYTDIIPQDTAVQTLTQMLAWNCCQDNIDPLGNGFHDSSGQNLDRISGHRDGCATECPGEAFYPTLSTVRQSVDDYIEEQCTPLVIDMSVDTIFTSVEQIIAGEEMLLRCRITNNGNSALENIEVQYLIDGTLLYTDLVQSINIGASKNLTEAHTFPMAGDYEYCIRIDDLDNEVDVTNNNYCGTLSVEINTATQELSAAQMAVFPNPSTGTFFLRNAVASTGQIQIFNTLGQSVLNTNLNGEHLQRIDLTNQSNGLYILRVTVEGKNYFEKLLLH